MLAPTLAVAYRSTMITPPQIRAARSLLGWTQTDLARHSGISVPTIKDLERGTTDPRSSTLAAIEEAFDAAGVIFLEVGDVRNGGRGVRLKQPQKP